MYQEQLNPNLRKSLTWRRWQQSIVNQFAFIFACFKSNFAAAIEYRVSFILQVAGMMINDTLWVLFWIFYFQKFPVLNGWGVNEVIMLWGTITFSFGLAFGLFWNIARLPELITQGHLDYYLALPKNVLLHLAISQIRPVNLGDMFFGPIVLLLCVPMTPEQWMIYLVGGLLGAVVYVSFFLTVGSLTFFMGQSESLTNNLAMSLVHFTTYPTRMFEGWIRVLLYTVIPAGFIAEVPVELMRSFSWIELGKFAGAAGIFATIGIATFYLGLRRYESGNLLGMRA